MNYVEQIQLHAEQIFASKRKADTWLNKPQSVFEGSTPLELVCCEAGYLRVKEALDRISHGYTF